MTTFICIASGQSANDIDRDAIRASGYPVIVANRAYELYPDANILVAVDHPWLAQHRPRFKGLIFTRSHFRDYAILNEEDMPAGINSGLFALHVARRLNGKRAILLGYDMHGEHFHGRHPEPLKNPVQRDFDRYIDQFSRFRGIEVVNCTKGSALPFPYVDFADALADRKNSG